MYKRLDQDFSSKMILMPMISLIPTTFSFQILCIKFTYTMGRYNNKFLSWSDKVLTNPSHQEII